MAKKKSKVSKVKKKVSKRKLKTYLVVYHQPPSAFKKMQKMTKEDGAKVAGEWMKWAKKCGSQLVDMGAPLIGGLRITADSSPVPSKRKVSGYSLLKAASMAGAKKLLKGHPHLNWYRGCEIEVHEVMPMG